MVTAKRISYYDGDILMLQCTSCKEIKSCDNFKKHLGKYYVGKCKTCTNKDNKEYRKKNVDKIKEQQKKYRDAHKKEKKEYMEQYNIQNIEHIKEYRKQRREGNKDKLRIQHNEYYNKNKDKIIEQGKEYYEKNKNNILERKKDEYIEHNELLGYNRGTFHNKARRYIEKHRLRPEKCPICGGGGKIEFHHPSYENFDMRKVGTFCCVGCHRLIHSGNITSFTIIDITNETS